MRYNYTAEGTVGKLSVTPHITGRRGTGEQDKFDTVEPE